jgi:hypothetical protein
MSSLIKPVLIGAATFFGIDWAIHGDHSIIGSLFRGPSDTSITPVPSRVKHPEGIEYVPGEQVQRKVPITPRPLATPNELKSEIEGMSYTPNYDQMITDAGSLKYKSWASPLYFGMQNINGIDSGQ